MATRRVKFSCPLHADVLLYERDVDGPVFDSERVVENIDTGRECPRCKRAYYEWECLPQEDQ